jgi:hypothetical protein
VTTKYLTLREEHRLRMFENRVLRRIFGPKRDEVTGGWRKLHNEELHKLYSSPDIIRMIKSREMRLAEHVASKSEMRNVFKILVRKREVKRHFDRLKSKRKYSIKMDVREIGLECLDSMNLA